MTPRVKGTYANHFHDNFLLPCQDAGCLTSLSTILAFVLLKAMEWFGEANEGL